MCARRIWVLVAVLAAVGAVGVARLGAGALAREDESLIWRMALEAKLEQAISCDFEDTPLRDVTAFIREKADLNIVIDPNVLAEREHLVTLKVRDVTVKSMLNMLMTLTRLKYVLKDRAVYIADAERAARAAPQYLRIYDVRDLLVTYEAVEGEADNGGGGNGEEGDQGRTSAARQGGAELVALLVMLTGPENWRTVMVLTGERGGEDEDEGRSSGSPFTSF